MFQNRTSFDLIQATNKSSENRCLTECATIVILVN